MERDHLEDFSIGGRIILNCFLKKMEELALIELIRLSRQKTVGSCHHDNKPVVSINRGKFFD